jgi:hypothetical protein
MGGITNLWFVACMKHEVKNKFMVVHDKANGQWEL